MRESAFLTVPELGRLLRLRRLSSVELVSACLARLERLGPKYETVSQVLRDPALAESRERDAELARGKDRGPLHGIPYGVKALVSLAATVVRRLRRAGAVLCATLTVAEMTSGAGAGNHAEGARTVGRSPWDISRWSGGSSSGSATAVAAGLLPFTLASETWGSIQYPAAFCGVSGLRPTFGRVSRHGATALSPTMDKLGPMARTAEDCGLVLVATAGADAHDPAARAPAFTLPPQGFGRRYRLGILRGTLDRTQAEVGRNFERSLEVLGEVADLVVDLDLPEYPYDALAGAVLDAESARAGLAWSRGHEYFRALRLRRSAAAALDRLLAQVDAVVAPTLPTVAWPVDTPPDQAYPEYSGGTSIAGAANLCGAPGLFLLNGWGEAGLPTSLQLTGRAGTEAILLRLGIEFQARTNFHQQRPPGL